MMGDDDHRLITASLRGNRRAFEEIVERYYRVIYRTAKRITGDAATAEDVTQDVFLAAYEKLGTFDFRHRFFSWLYRMAVNQSLNKLRGRERIVEFDEEGIEGNGQAPDSTYDSERIGTIVDGALGRLSVDSRTVIVLYHYQELSYDEISYILDIPVKKVKSRLYEARVLLRALVKQGAD